MKSNGYPECYDVLNEIKRQKEITYLFPIEINNKELKIIDTMQSNVSNNLADIFSLAMRPCAAAFIKENKICLFANYGVLSKIDQKENGVISTGEYCNKIFNLMKQLKLEDLKFLYYAKIASQQKSSFLTKISSITKDGDIKKELSSKYVNSYEIKEGIEKKFDKLFLLGKKVELCVENLCSEESDLKELSLKIRKKAQDLFSSCSGLLSK